MKFETIIFDMDGVVVDSQHIYEKATIDFCLRHGVIYAPADIETQVIGMSLLESTEFIKNYYGLKGDTASLNAERAEGLIKLFETSLGFIAGFEAFFKKITALGYRTCVATATEGSALLDTVKRRLDLNTLFQNNIFDLSQVGLKAKPDPAIFLYAAKQMNTDPSKCAVIEDSIPGLQGAKRAGMYAIGIATTFPADFLKSDADAVATSFEDMYDMFFQP